MSPSEDIGIDTDVPAFFAAPKNPNIRDRPLEQDLNQDLNYVGAAAKANGNALPGVPALPFTDGSTKTFRMTPVQRRADGFFIIQRST